MSSKELSALLSRYGEFRVQKAILLYVSPVILLVGCVGNVLSFLILLRPPLRHNSTYFYLSVLSLADLLILLSGLLRQWLNELTGFDLTVQADWLCSSLLFISYVSTDYSVWLLVAVTFERYVVVCHPLRAVAVCTRRRAAIAVLVIFAAIVALNAHFLFTTNVRHKSSHILNYTVCEGKPRYYALVHEAWPWVDLCIYSFVPFFVLSLLNSFIIRTVCSAEASRSALQASTTQNTHSADCRKMTLMLLSVNLVFVVLSLPMTVYNVISSMISTTSTETLVKYQLARNCCLMLMYSNHSVNFFLYCATGQRFRQQLFVFFGRSRNSAELRTSTAVTFKSRIDESEHERHVLLTQLQRDSNCV